MENKQHDCDDVGCVACILEKHLMGLWERVTDPAFRTFEVTAGDIQMLLTSIETDQHLHQISALLDIDDAGAIPDEKPLDIADAVWDVIKSGDDISKPHLFRMSRIVYISCLLSIDEALHWLSIGEISNAVLLYGHANMLFGQTVARGFSAYAKGSLHDTASAGARAKAAKDSDGKQAVKRQVKGMWDEWQKYPARYRGKAAFARDMLDKFEALQSQDVIERWCRGWEKGTLPAE